MKRGGFLAKPQLQLWQRPNMNSNSPSPGLSAATKPALPIMQSLQFIFLFILLLRSTLSGAIYSLKWKKKSDSSLVNYIWYLGHKLDIFGLDNLKHFMWNDTLHCNFGRWWGISEGPVCCSPWGSKESDTTGRLNNNHLTLYTLFCFWPQDFNTKYHPSVGYIINLPTSPSINQFSIQFTSFKKKSLPTCTVQWTSGKAGDSWCL